MMMMQKNMMTQNPHNVYGKPVQSKYRDQFDCVLKSVCEAKGKKASMMKKSADGSTILSFGQERTYLKWRFSRVLAEIEECVAKVHIGAIGFAKDWQTGPVTNQPMKHPVLSTTQKFHNIYSFDHFERMTASHEEKLKTAWSGFTLKDVFSRIKEGAKQAVQTMKTTVGLKDKSTPRTIIVEKMKPRGKAVLFPTNEIYFYYLTGSKYTEFHRKFNMVLDQLIQKRPIRTQGAAMSTGGSEQFQRLWFSIPMRQIEYEVPLLPASSFGIAGETYAARQNFGSVLQEIKSTVSKVNTGAEHNPSLGVRAKSALNDAAEKLGLKSAPAPAPVKPRSARKV